MKRYLFSFFVFVFFVGLASADVLVHSESGAQKYPDGTTLNVDAIKNITVEYKNTRIFIPQGQKVSLRFSQADENNLIFITGTDLKNIKIGSDTISSSGSFSFTINSITGELYIESGSLEVVDKNGNVAFYTQGQSYKLQLDNGSKDGFLPINLQKKSAYEQSEQDIILSPSAPR